ncbi:MAG: hypothetical protein AAF813_09540 [Pseudomonadota bacterium]
MKTQDLVQHAHALYRAHGDQAEVEAAQKEKAASTPAEAEDWRSIRFKIKELRGPRMT